MKRDILVGFASAAHQIEGNNIHSDWYEFEKGMTNGVGSDMACNSYELYKEDSNLIKHIGANAYRFSIEWSRINPEPDLFVLSEVEHYREVLKDLHEKGLTPIVTLHHFTNPAWFEKMGGWENKNSSRYFLTYLDYLLKNLKFPVEYFITYNEPNMYVGSKYLQGIWSPYKKSFFASLKAYRNIIKMHNLSYDLIKKYYPKSHVGLSNHHIYCKAYNRWNPLDQLISKVFSYLSNNFVLNRIQNKIDFIGMNFYTSITLKFSLTKLLTTNPSLLDIYKTHKHSLYTFLSPKELPQAFKQLCRYNKPILITENGIMTSYDTERTTYINEVKSLLDSIKDHKFFMGYLYWTLVDNFEWSFAYRYRYGIYSLDKKTFLRIPKESTKAFKQLVESII